MPDLVGIGSINVDLVLDSTAGAEVDLTDPRLGLRPEDLGGELAIDAARSRAALEYLERFDPVVGAGGSALNVCAVAVAAAVRAPISVGHIGVCGLDGPSGFSLPAWFRRLGIDTSHVETVAGPPGLCLAITRDGERTLLTTGGVNDRLGRLLAERADEVVGYLGRARAIHVTSLAGLDDLEPVLAVIDRVRARHPDVRLSCDPGAVWTAPDRPAAVDEIVGRCHQLLVNGREFDAIGGAAALDRWPAVEQLVLKSPEAIEIHRRARPVERYPNPEVVPASEIVDDTGSGDAFAAGFLLGQLVDDIGPGGGIELGLDLARAKLAFPGLTEVERLADVAHPYLGDAPRRPSV